MRFNAKSENYIFCIPKTNKGLDGRSCAKKNEKYQSGVTA